MSSMALSGNDSLTLNDYVFSDFSDENVVEVTFPSDIATVKTGKNGNSIFGLNETGKQCELKIRLIRGTADDSFMQNLLTQQQANFAGTILLQGQFVKKVGDGKGNITSDTYILGGGVYTKQVEGKSNVAGDTDQSIVMYMMKFATVYRVLT